MTCRINSTADYHIRDINTLGWELTVCNTLQPAGSPARRILCRDASYGKHLCDYLNSFLPLKEIRCVIEIGGGYGYVMEEFLKENQTARATMLDISPFLIEKQRETLADFDVRFIVGDFLDVGMDLLKGHELAILNENLGDFPTCVGLDRVCLFPEGPASDAALQEVRRFFETYSLEPPRSSPFHFNLGALQSVEKLCLSGIPYIFIGEHSCEAVLPEPLRALLRMEPSYNPERIPLRGHDEYTLRFSYLERVARFHQYRTVRGPFADFLAFDLTDRIRTTMVAPSAGSDEQEIIRHFIGDLYKYEYLILIRNQGGI